MIDVRNTTESLIYSPLPLCESVALSVMRWRFVRTEPVLHPPCSDTATLLQ